MGACVPRIIQAQWKKYQEKSVLGCLIAAENFQKADMYPLAFQGALSWPEVVIQISTKRAPI